MKYVISIFSTIIILVIICSFNCCTDPLAIDVRKSKAETKESLVLNSGIYFKDGPNDPIGMGLFGNELSVTNNELFDIIDTWTYYENTDAKKVNVYIDMSNGVNQGIEQSQEHMESLTLTLKNDAAYFKVGGSDSDEGEYRPEPLNVPDYTQAYTTFTDKSYYKDGRSKLRAGLQACINDTENITVFVTDFLLDEGKVRKKPQDSYSNIRRRIYEDGTPWAITEFTKWFKGNNVLEIISVEHTLSKGYGCEKIEGCSKQIYYMFFIPAQLVNMNSAIDDMISEMKTKERTNYLKINPLAFGVKNNNKLGVGNVEYDYKASKKHAPININNYKVQFVPINIPMMAESISEKDGFTVFQDISLINNLDLIDRDNNNSSPYKIDLDANFYDLTELFYQLGSINKGQLANTAPPMKFDANNYPGNLVDQGDGHIKMIDARDLKEKDGLFEYDKANNSIIMNSNTLQTQSFWLGDKDHGKLYLCDIVINDIYFEDYNQEFLKWTFWYYGGYLDNVSLTQSISRALYTNKNNYKGKIIYSYLIALNDNK